MSSVIAGLGEWNLVGGEGGCKVVSDKKKNKIGEMERMPKPEQTGGPWLGWPTTCRGVSFKGVRVGVQNRSVHPSPQQIISSFPRPFDRRIYRDGSSWKTPSVPCPASYGKSIRRTSSRDHPRVDFILLNRRLATEDTDLAHKRRKYHTVALGSLVIA
jgi:hypothetical protein